MDIQSFTPLWGVWHISRQLGSGSFGDVYEAKRTDTGREYLAAVKHIPIPPKGTNMQSLQADGIVTDEASARSYCKGLLDTLTKEIDICYELKGHTNFVSYEDHMIVPRQNEIGYDVFIRMELLSTLPSFITQNGITVGGITKLCEDMCNALSFLEQKRIIHRDIKPANIFVSSSGDFKLGDFGVARHMEGLGSMSVKGTYNYMAPEILKGEAVGANSDVYSLGLVLYRLLNYNRAPFLPPPPAKVSFDEDQAALDKRLGGAALPPPARADLSLPLTNVVMRACEYEAARRFQSAGEMKAALQSFRETQTPPTGFDPDATVAVERNAQSAAQFGTGASAWNRQSYGMSQGSMMQQGMSQGSIVQNGMSQGSMMQQGSMNQSGFFGGTNMPAPPQQGQNKTMLGVLIGVISLVAVTLLALVVILVLPRLSEGTTAPEQESLTEQSDFPQWETPLPEPVANPDYLYFDDPSWQITCPYPSHFVERTAGEANALLSLVSPDGAATMTISAEENTYGLNAEQAKQNHISSKGNTVTFNTGGNTWYVVSGFEGDMIYYRKAVVSPSSIRSFDLVYPKSQQDIYGSYIIDIEKNFSSDEASTLRAEEITIPPDQNIGDRFIVRGVIYSEDLISSVTVSVYNSSGYAETTMTMYPNDYEFNLEEIDKHILFDYLARGNKIYEISATDEVGTKTLTYSSFTVY